MPRQFAHSTAEQVIQAIDAVNASGAATVEQVESFCALSKDQAQNALSLAVDLGLLKLKRKQYIPCNPLVRFIATPEESIKSALMRVMLESYTPFVVFRQRLAATDSPDLAAQQTKSLCDLDAHREDIKHTLISLGTYSSALIGQGGGRYATANNETGNSLLVLADAAQDLASSEHLIRKQIGSRADVVDRQEVLIPLSSALLKAKSGDGLGAVADAARGIESFLARLGDRKQVSLAGANGIVQKLDKFRSNNILAKKTVEAAKYLGHVRNAADHGVDIDPDVGQVWHIQVSTGLNYVFVACAFIASALEQEINGDFTI